MRKTFNIIAVLTVTMLFAACVSLKPKNKSTYKIDIYMSEEEQSHWHTFKDTLYHDSIPVGIFQSNEWEYSNDQLILEISIRTLNPFYAETLDIIRYVHARQPNAKIEVNRDGTTIPEE